MKSTDWKLGMSSCCRGSIDHSVFEEYAQNGIDMMEISLNHSKYPEINLQETKKNAEETGVQIWSFHLPFEPFETNDISSNDAQIRKNTITLQSEYIKWASDLGAKVAVIHPSAEPNAENERSEKIKCAKESLFELAEVATQNGVILAVEDLPRTCLGNCIAEIKDLISAHVKLRVCLDTNHLLTESNIDFIREFGNKIVTIHVSDYDYRNERHWLPYEGDVDWVKLVTELENAGYCGPFMYEVGLKTPPSINRRDLTFKDFKENYLACINKVKAEKIGERNLKKCDETAYYKIPIIKHH